MFIQEYSCLAILLSIKCMNDLPDSETVLDESKKKVTSPVTFILWEKSLTRSIINFVRSESGVTSPNVLAEESQKGEAATEQEMIKWNKEFDRLNRSLEFHTDFGLKTVMKIWIETAIAKIHKAISANNVSDQINDWTKIPFEISEYQRVLEELNKDAKISAHFNSIIESEAFPEPLAITPERTLEIILGTFLVDNQPFFEEVLFNKSYDLLENSFYNDFIEFQAIAPIQGLYLNVVKEKKENSISYDDDLEPWVISSDLKIRPLNDWEFQRVHNLEIVRRYRFRMSDKIYAINATYRFNKKLTPVSSRGSVLNSMSLDHNPLEIKMSEVNQLITEMVWALRLFKQGDISNSGSIHYAKNIFAYNGERLFISELPSPFGNVNPYMLIKEDKMEFKTLWEKFQKAKSNATNKHLFVALRRLNYSRTRSDLEDKAIDLMITAEALAKPPNTGDKNTAIANHFAGYFPGKENNVKEIMLKVYGIRNAIIHDGSLDKWTKTYSNRSINVIDYISKAEEFARLVLIEKVLSCH